MPTFRKNIKKILLNNNTFIIFFLKFFFKSEYLHGKYFQNDLRGYIWSFRSLWSRNLLRLAPPLPFPASHMCTITNQENLYFHPEDINNFQSPGTYFQCSKGKIILDKGVFIAPNVGLITANHDLQSLDKHLPGGDIEIGAGCWIGMNSVIMPNVKLGPRTIVAAGSVVTRSFPLGNCMIAGTPAVHKRELSFIK